MVVPNIIVMPDGTFPGALGLNGGITVIEIVASGTKSSDLKAGSVTTVRGTKSGTATSGSRREKTGNWQKR